MEIHKRKHPQFHKALCAFLPERCPYCDCLIECGKLCCENCRDNLSAIVYKKPAKGGYPCISSAPYTGNFAQAIKRFKFQNRRQYGFQLATIMAKAILEEYGDKEFDYITYVPMHRIKQAERGYNQSKVLAKKLSVILNIPVASVLAKTRNNPAQHDIKKAVEREKNVRGAFKVTSKNAVKNKNILIIDDIITTGNTLGECCRMLCKCNPANIYCATFAVAVAKTT